MSLDLVYLIRSSLDFLSIKYIRTKEFFARKLKNFLHVFRVRFFMSETMYILLFCGRKVSKGLVEE